MSSGVARLLCGLVLCALALAGCAGTSAPEATKTVTVTVTPPPVSVVAPIKLPPGSEVYNRTIDEHTGAWVDMWQVPFEGPNAMTESQIIDFLQAQLPGGRPYETDRTHLEWCRGGKNFWSWQKPASAGPPNEPDVVDRLYVEVYASAYVKIERDAEKPFDCGS